MSLRDKNCHSTVLNYYTVCNVEVKVNPYSVYFDCRFDQNFYVFIRKFFPKLLRFRQLFFRLKSFILKVDITLFLRDYVPFKFVMAALSIVFELRLMIQSS